jgi:hypothetical protein
MLIDIPLQAFGIFRRHLAFSRDDFLKLRSCIEIQHVLTWRNKQFSVFILRINTIDLQWAFTSFYGVILGTE